jgi:hypothetical protein
MQARFYFQHRDGSHTVDHTLGSSSQTEISIPVEPGTTKIGIVLSNLDSERSSEYEIVLN